MQTKIKIRGNDAHGSGVYKASRGSREHNGIDICCDKGDVVPAFSTGTVTKIGFPYSQAEGADPVKAKLRYIQITDDNGLDVRYFYVNPSLEVGDTVLKNDIIGINRGASHIYPRITEHFHFEILIVINGKKVFCDPVQYLKAFGYSVE